MVARSQPVAGNPLKVQRRSSRSTPGTVAFSRLGWPSDTEYDASFLLSPQNSTVAWWAAGGGGGRRRPRGVEGRRRGAPRVWRGAGTSPRGGGAGGGGGGACGARGGGAGGGPPLRTAPARPRSASWVNRPNSAAPRTRR